MKKHDYKVLSGALVAGYDGLPYQVEEHLEAGYDLVGGVFVTSARDRLLYHQAMVRHT